MARKEETVTNFCHPENLGSTHWVGCDCHEAQRAAKLAEANACLAERDRWLREMGDAMLEAGVNGNLAVSEGVAAFCAKVVDLEKKLAAAEARVKALEEALREIADESSHDACCMEYGDDGTCAVERARAALSSPAPARETGGEK